MFRVVFFSYLFFVLFFCDEEHRLVVPHLALGGGSFRHEGNELEDPVARRLESLAE